MNFLHIFWEMTHLGDKSNHLRFCGALHPDAEIFLNRHAF